MDRAVRRGVLPLVMSGLVAGLVATAGAIVLTDIAAAAPAATDLSLPGGSGSAPQLRVDATGEVTAVWYRIVGDVGTVQTATRPVGGGWSAAADLSAPGPAATSTQTAESPPVQLAANPAGDAVAVWIRSNGSNVIVQATSRPAGGAWSSPVDLSAVGQDALGPKVAIDDAGNATAVWYRSDGSNTIVQTRTKPAGGAWSSVLDLSAAGVNARVPDVSVDPAGNATAVWHLSVAIAQAASRPAGEAWGSAVDLGSGSHVEVASSGPGRALAVWMSYEGSAFVVRSALRPTADGDWGSSVPVSGDDPGSARLPRVGLDEAGNAVVTWYRDQPASFVVQAVTGSPDGTWSSPVGLSSGSAERPEVAMSRGGDAAVVWMSWNGSNFIIQMATRPAGGTWRPKVDLSALGGTASGARAALTPSALVQVAWTRYASGQAIVQTVLVDPLAPPEPEPSPTPSPTPTIPPPVPPPAPTSTPHPTQLKPTLAGVKLTRKTIHVVTSDESPRSTKLKLTLNTDSTVKIVLKRTQKVDGKAVKAKVSKALVKGAAAIKLTAKIGSKKLPPGTYVVAVTATNSVGTSAATKVRLKILA